MTIQEEIREGINERIGDCLISIGCGEGSCPHQEMKEEEAQETCLESILKYLDSQGMVLKVAGHVEFNLTGITPTQWSEISKAYKEAGYEAVASLM